jgi:hypothetical protein
MIGSKKGNAMRPLLRKVTPLLFAAVFASPFFLGGCQNRETVYYNRWEHETHRDHVELNRRAAAEQKEYSDWRQKQDERH